MPDPQTQSSRIYYGYWLIGAAFVAQFVAVGVQNYVTGPFMTPMIDEFGWSRSAYTLPRTIGQVVMAITGFVIGSSIDRRGAQPFMFGGMVILAASLYALSFTNSLWMWIFLNGVVLSLGAALIGNLVVNVTLSKWFVELRGRAVALSAMGVSFAGVALTPAITWVIDTWGWRTGWQSLAVMTIVLILPVALMMRRAPEDHGLHPDGRSEHEVAAGLGARAAMDFSNSLTRSQALRTPAFYLLVLAFGLMVINIPVLLIHSLPYLEDAGHARDTASLMIFTASVPAMIAKPIWGWFIDRVEGRPLASLCALITAVGTAWIVYGANSEGLLHLYIGYFLLGTGWGGMIPIQEVIWAGFFGRRYLGAVRSAAMPITLALSSLAPLAAAGWADVSGSYDGAMLTVAALALVAAALVPTIRRPVADQAGAKAP